MRFQIATLAHYKNLSHFCISIIPLNFNSLSPPKKKYYSHFAGEKAELKFIKPGSRGAELFIPV